MPTEKAKAIEGGCWEPETKLQENKVLVASVPTMPPAPVLHSILSAHEDSIPQVSAYFAAPAMP